MNSLPHIPYLLCTGSRVIPTRFFELGRDDQWHRVCSFRGSQQLQANSSDLNSPILLVSTGPV